MSNDNENEYMSLATGIGIIPVEHRNRGYEKLDFEPGEGGVPVAAAAPAADDDRVEGFLAGVAAGADPQELAKSLLKGSATSRRSRR